MGEITGDVVFSDWHLCIDGSSPGVFYPGGLAINDEHMPFANKLLKTSLEGEVQEKIQLGEEIKDWRIEVEGASFRVHFEKTISGNWLLFRRVTDKTPQIEELIPPAIRHLLIHDALLKGGLIVVAGAAGEGKSTTCAATVVSRLKKFGGLCWTIEDPAEFPLNGTHGEGICRQTELVGDQSLAEAIKEKKRAFPAKTHGILMLGEVRDEAAIGQALQAALSGLLVIVTLHSNDVISAITRIINSGGTGGSSHWRNIVAQVLKMVINQRFVGNKMEFECVVVDGDTSVVGNLIKDDRTRSIRGEIDMQERYLSLGKPLFTKNNR